MEMSLQTTYCTVSTCLDHRVMTTPLPLRVGKAGKNNFNEEITFLLPTGIGERYSQIKLRTSSAHNYAYVNSPYKRKCWTNSGGPFIKFITLRPWLARNKRELRPNHAIPSYNATTAHYCRLYQWVTIQRTNAKNLMLPSILVKAVSLPSEAKNSRYCMTYKTGNVLCHCKKILAVFFLTCDKCED